MKTLEELEKEYELAYRKWSDLVDKQCDMTDEAISTYQNGKSSLSELISQLQDADKIDDDAWVKRYEIYKQIIRLKIDNEL